MISQKQLVQTSCGQVGAAGGTTFRRLVVPVTPRLVGALRAPGKILPVAPERDGAAFGRGLSALASATGAGERSGSDGGRASSGKGASTSGSVGSDSRPRLAKVLAACGVASRRACEGLIADGRVRVNGNLVKEQGTTVDPARDKVEVFRSPDAAVAPATDGAAAAAAKTAGAKAAATATAAAAAKAAGKPAGGKAAAAAGGAVTAASASGVAGHWAVVPVRQFQDSESLYYFAVNKPKGYICTNSDPDGRAKLAVDLLAPWLSTWGRNNKDKKRLPPRLFTVGRLDVASTGLLFITNDGVWANSVMHPSSGVTKEYVVGVEEDASRQQLETLAAGTEVAGTFVSPLEVEVLGDPRRLRIVVAEGKKHEVRELVKAAGMNLLSLRRVRIGPTNGFALIIHHRRLNLSPTVSMDVLQVAWEQLKAQAASWNPALPKDLVWRSPPQVAMLAYLCQEWRYSRRASTAAELVEQTMTEKLIPEVLADLRMVLQLLGQPAAQLKLLRKLLDPMAGVEPAALPLAFKVLLASFATEREGRLYLDYPLFAQVLQAVTKDSGELLDSITAVKSISSKKFRELVVMGECCKDTENFDSYKDLHSLLEDMASALALTPDGLLKADWFIQVLDHLRNSCGSKANFEEKYGAQARQDVKVGLRWFHGLLRNVLSHGSISEQQQALDAYPSELAEFHSSGRISEVLTKTYDRPMPRRSRTRGASAAATPRAQPQPYAGPVRPISLHLGKRLLGRAAVTQPRYIM